MQLDAINRIIINITYRYCSHPSWAGSWEICRIQPFLFLKIFFLLLFSYYCSHEDTGVYTCITKNSFGFSVTSARLCIYNSNIPPPDHKDTQEEEKEEEVNIIDTSLPPPDHLDTSPSPCFDTIVPPPDLPVVTLSSLSVQERVHSLADILGQVCRESSLF